MKITGNKLKELLPDDIKDDVEYDIFFDQNNILIINESLPANSNKQVEVEAEKVEAEEKKDSFNTGQKFIFDDIIKNAKAFKDEEYFDKKLSLIGSAGTGKTWLTAKLIKELINMDISIAMTTPTHKALSVIKEMLKENDISEEDAIPSTIHHFLNLKLDYGFGDDGSADNVSSKPKLKINKHNECLAYVDILFIDESSMISEELYNISTSILGDRCKIIIFVGDQFQLKPVEGGENIIYNHPEIKHYELIETVRQKKGSSVINLANRIRDYIKIGNYPHSIIDEFKSEEEIQILTDAEFLPTYFENKNKKIIGAYTNKMVDEYNKYIRYIETKSLEYLIEGDIIVFQKPYSNSTGEVVFQNGQEVAIESTKKVLDEKSNLWYWRCKAQGRLFNILDTDSETDYKLKIKELADKANLAKGYDKRNAWKAFFKLQTRFGFIKYSFASTLHKLQGSTVNSMFFEMRDVLRFYKNDPDNTLRLIYVAITRTSDKLFILKD